MPGLDGPAMFSIVRGYAGLGIHRSGTPVDAATAAWMIDQLAGLGLSTTTEPFGFDRWRAQSRLTADGTDIEHLALPYQWVGSVASDNVFVGPVDPKSGGSPAMMEAALASLDVGDADVAVLGTEHPEGALVGVNRRVEDPTGTIPVLLVAGRDLGRLGAASVHAAVDAALEPGTTFNIVGRNERPGRPLLLTTPLNGWFGCAGERGTGIAVLLALVERFADLPLLVVATGGHELSYLGGHAWVDAAVTEPGEVRPAAVVHVGASVAVEHTTDTGRELIPTRLAMTSLDADAARPIAAALAPVGLAPATSVESWLGEGEAFSKLGVPLLSFTGAGIDFHTPDDTPERATSPGALEQVAAAIGDAAEALYDAATP